MHERARDHSVDAIKTGETAKPGSSLNAETLCLKIIDARVSGRMRAPSESSAGSGSSRICCSVLHRASRASVAEESRWGPEGSL